jgi:uncharacterized membrane protein
MPVIAHPVIPIEETSMLYQNAVHWIEAQAWLDSFGDMAARRVTTVYDEIGGDGSVRALVSGAWLGHPLHAALSDIPMGAWAATMALDVCEVVAGRTDVAPGADLAMAVGVAGAVASCVTGWSDWTERRAGEGSGRVGVFHGLLSGAATALCGASLALRLGCARQRRLAQGLGAAGFAVAAASAWLGAAMVYHRRLPSEGP